MKNLDSLIRDFARSPLIDSDKEKKDRPKKRRRFLLENRAIIPSELPESKLEPLLKK